MKRNARELSRLADELGWSLSYTRGGHLVFRRPGCQPVYTSSTPGDHRERRNLISLLRRAEREATPCPTS